MQKWLFTVAAVKWIKEFVVGFVNLLVIFFYSNIKTLVFPLRPILNKICLKDHNSLGDFFQLFPLYFRERQVFLGNFSSIVKCRINTHIMHFLAKRIIIGYELYFHKSKGGKK